ncbi:MAG: hypothetical protein ACE5KP_07605 [Dehalococcoidales bacterium]
MSKKMKVLVSVLVAILVLTVGGTTIAMAQEGEEPEPQDEELTEEVESNRLLTRVAEILGIPEEELVEAFQQARQEMMAERWEVAFNRLLEKAVAEGLLTPEEAEEIREWWAQKPEALDPGLLRHAFGFWNQHRGQLPGVRQGQRPEIRQRLALKFQERARERLGITQDESAEMNQWWQDRPEVFNQLPPQARIFKAFRNQPPIAAPKGWHGPMPNEIAD